MSRTPEIQTGLKAALETIEETVYRPLPKDRELKARYWLRLQDDPFAVTDLAGSRETAERLTGQKIKSWDEPGFQDWFFNRDEHRQKLEYLYSLALDAAQDILVSTDPKVQGARVQVIKVIADLAGKTPKAAQNTQINIGAKIEAMSPEALEKFLQKGAESMLQQAEPIQLSLDKGDIK